MDYGLGLGLAALETILPVIRLAARHCSKGIVALALGA